MNTDNSSPDELMSDPLLEKAARLPARPTIVIPCGLADAGVTYGH